MIVEEANVEVCSCLHPADVELEFCGVWRRHSWRGTRLLGWTVHSLIRYLPLNRGVSDDGFHIVGI
jgi:hypothetical protein